MHETDERVRDCPYFGKKIGIELCTYVSQCALGWCNKLLVPEVTDWEKAKELCSKCPHRFD